MPGVIRKLLSFRKFLNQRKDEPDEIIEEKWIADFSRQKHARFDIKSESSYDANLRKNLFYSGYSLALGLKKTGCIAWVEAPDYRYGDMVISGTIRIDARGGYGAGGMLFRMVDSGTYYSFLISSKGYFRLDALRNGMPFPLMGWTELPLSSAATLGPDHSVDFSIIAYGSHIIILARGRWAAEVNDSSILNGTLCFTAASYESGDPAYRVIREDADPKNASYTTEVVLEALTVESRIAEVAAFFEKWRDSPDIDSKARTNLAETFTAMNQHNAAMVQLQKAWDTAGHKKTQAELLLAGRLAQALGLMSDAEAYISQCFQANLESPEGKEALTEMAKILYAEERFRELGDYCAEAVKINADDPVLWTFNGHAFWNFKEYKKAAAAYDRAFDLDRENGILAKNAANVYDVMGRVKDALGRYLEAGKVFLNAGNYNDLGLLVPKLLSLGEKNTEARSLAGKWAFAVEDWKMAEEQFKAATELRKRSRPKAPKDSAQIFLESLLLIRTGKRRDALPLLEEAASLEKDYALYHFRLAENLFLLDDDADDSRMLKEMNAALALSSNNTESDTDEGLAGWINNFAAQVALRKGNLDAAEKHLEKAVEVLGDLPAIRVNQGVLFYLRGSLDKAMELLGGDRQADPEGVMTNCAGNLLVRSERYEDANEKYRQALVCQPDNVEYLCNRSSCLIKLGLYGEADELLARAHTISPGPAVLEMISYVAARKGEYDRAEQACRSALEIDPRHAPSLLSLGWVLVTLKREEEARDIILRLDKLELKEDIARGRDELRTRLDDMAYMTIGCASCERSWKIARENKPVPAIRLYAMPPDELPAGSCLSCGKTYCIGCAQKNLDASGRFICPACNKPLKLVNEGLKKIIYNWAVKDGIIDKKGKAEKKAGRKAKKEEIPNDIPIVKHGRGRPRKTPPSGTVLSGLIPSGPAQTEQKIEAPKIKRGRGRPRKSGN